MIDIIGCYPCRREKNVLITAIQRIEEENLISNLSNCHPSYFCVLISLGSICDLLEVDRFCHPVWLQFTSAFLVTSKSPIYTTHLICFNSFLFAPNRYAQFALHTSQCSIWYPTYFSSKAAGEHGDLGRWRKVSSFVVEILGNCMTKFWNK